jgi:hypothetical protein
MNNYENLGAVVRGIELTTYQKSLAKDELSYLLTENKMLTEALAESDKKLDYCEKTCELHEQMGAEISKNQDDLLNALIQMAGYYLHEQELEDEDLKKMQQNVVDLIERFNDGFI